MAVGSLSIEDTAQSSAAAPTSSCLTANVVGEIVSVAAWKQMRPRANRLSLALRPPLKTWLTSFGEPTRTPSN